MHSCDLFCNSTKMVDLRLYAILINVMVGSKHIVFIHVYDLTVMIYMLYQRIMIVILSHYFLCIKNHDHNDQYILGKEARISFSFISMFVFYSTKFLCLQVDKLSQTIYYMYSIDLFYLIIISTSVCLFITVDQLLFTFEKFFECFMRTLSSQIFLNQLVFKYLWYFIFQIILIAKISCRKAVYLWKIAKLSHHK